MSDQQPPSLREGLQAAARRSGFGRVAPGETPSAGALLAAMGGVRGLVESVLPGVAFLVVYTITQQLLPSVLIPLGVAAVFVVIRLVTGTPWMSAVAGIVGVGISAVIALITGRASDNFLPALLMNTGFLLALLVSLAVRRPLIGVIAALLTGEGPGWRADRAKRRVAVIATLMWVGLFVLRLSVQVPLYLADATQALAAFRLALGVPPYALLVWVTWLLMRTAYARPQEPTATS